MRRNAGVRWWGPASAAVLLAAGLATAAPAREPAAPTAWLGVVTQELTPELREGIEYQGASGVLVSRVVKDSPADEAGLRKGDVIVSVNSRAVDAPRALVDIVRAAKVGQEIAIGVVRGDVKRTLAAKLAARPEEQDLEPGAPPQPPAPGELRFKPPRGREWQGVPHDLDIEIPDVRVLMPGRGRLGVRIETLNPDLADAVGVRGGRGVLVLEVLKDTPALKAGLKAGDVITRVDDQAVVDTEDLVQALREKEGRVSLDVMRKGVTRNVEAELEPAPRALRPGPGEGMLGDRGPTIRREIRIRGGDRDDIRRELDQLRRQLDELQKQLEQERDRD
ncbi:MAG: PDZ domain-containing protein [Candidatus Eisenbacteria bacterium]|nr:PDZ domain-containing protein [Candidatus Eisenbacteria bacterium]